MEAIVKRYFWVVRVLGFAVATGLAASALVTQFGTQLLLRISDEPDAPGDAGDEDDEAEDPADKTGPEVASRRKPRLANNDGVRRREKRRVSTEILARNIFCPTCIAEELAPGITPSDLGGEVAAETGEVRSQLPLRVMATMEATDPELSLATIYDLEHKSTGLFGFGDYVRPDVEVVGVELGIVHLRNIERLEFIEMGDPQVPPPAATPPSAAAAPQPRAPSKREIPGARDAINCPNENTCIVERKFVEEIMSNPAMLAKQARIVPHQKNGETEGFKFYGIRRGTLPKLLGMKNGDLLTEVNGEEMRSFDQAMGLAMKLRHASNLSVTLVRRGKPIHKEIQIQ